MMNGKQQEARQFDTIYDTDERFRLAETDANLVVAPESCGRRRVGVAIVGVGRMGAIHLYNVLREPRAKVLYVLDSSRKRLAHMDEKYFLAERGIKTLLTDGWPEVLADKAVEACLISTPTFTHEQYARTALEAGKHVLCEKPLAETTDKVDSLTRLASANQLKLVCAFQRRYDPSFRRVAESAKRGDIGDVRLIKTCSRDSPLPPLEYIKISGGLFHDCCVHDVDAILWIAEELPCQAFSWAHAYLADYRDLDDFDTAVATLRFPSGKMAVMDLSRVSGAGYEQRLEVFGPKGVLKVDEFARAGWERHADIGLVRPSQCYSFGSRYVEAYAAEITELLNHIEGHATLHPILPGYLQALCKIVTAVERSARTGQPVELEWTPAEVAAALP